MPASGSLDFAAILQVLARHAVDFIVVGGVAGAVHGSPLATFDLDVVHSTRPENIDRLLAALEELDAYYRIQPDLRLRPAASRLSSPGHQLLLTRFGPLDLLGRIGEGQGYDELVPESVKVEIGGALIRVLSLEALIAIKESMPDAKDRIALAVLRRILEERRRAD